MTKLTRIRIGQIAAIGALLFLFAISGVVLFARSQAAGAAVSAEAENGTRTGSAAAVADSTASNTGAVKFATPAVADEKFMLVVIPDTQVTIAKWPADFTAQIDWIINNAAAQDIRFVLHVGDIQEWPATISYYERARAGMNKLDGVVPYTIGIGNHDFDKWSIGTHTAIAADRSATLFNQYFPLSKFKSLPSFVESHPVGSNDNSAHKFSAGGTDYLIVTLKYRPTAAELAWANSVVSANPLRRTMVVTHEYLNGSGVRTATGNNIWETFAKKHKNMEFVFSGHINPGARRVDPGTNGNPVHQINSDYQNYNVREPNSYIRLMTFDPVAKTLKVRTYSPALNLYMTGASNDFTLTGVPFGPVL